MAELLDSGWLVPGLLALVGVLLVALTVHLVRQGLRTARWPHVLGRIVYSGVRTKRGGLKHEPFHRIGHGYTMTSDTHGVEVAYAYQVHGVPYVGHRISLVQVATSIRSAASNKAAQYPIGAPVSVHYDPHKPGDSYLEPGVPFSSGFFGLAGVAFCIAALWISPLHRPHPPPRADGHIDPIARFCNDPDALRAAVMRISSNTDFGLRSGPGYDAAAIHHRFDRLEALLADGALPCSDVRHLQELDAANRPLAPATALAVFAEAGRILDSHQAGHHIVCLTTLTTPDQVMKALEDSGARLDAALMQRLHARVDAGALSRVDLEPIACELLLATADDDVSEEEATRLAGEVRRLSDAHPNP